MNSRIGKMLSESIRHLEIRHKWISRNHRNKRSYFKHLRRTEKAWQRFLKADSQLTPEDKIWFQKELANLLENY